MLSFMDKKGLRNGSLKNHCLGVGTGVGATEECEECGVVSECEGKTQGPLSSSYPGVEGHSSGSRLSVAQALS